MKTTFALLLGLLLLESCATMNKPIQTLSTPGLADLCQVTQGIYVIVIDNTGAPQERVCPDIKTKKITKKRQLDPGLSQIGTELSLGKVAKFSSNTDPDPCIQWSVGGNMYYYCW